MKKKNVLLIIFLLLILVYFYPISFLEVSELEFLDGGYQQSRFLFVEPGVDGQISQKWMTKDHYKELLDIFDNMKVIRSFAFIRNGTRSTDKIENFYIWSNNEVAVVNKQSKFISINNKEYFILDHDKERLIKLESQLAESKDSDENSK